VDQGGSVHAHGVPRRGGLRACRKSGAANSSNWILTVIRLVVKMRYMVVFAQLSDTHFDGSQERADRAAKVMAHLNEAPQPLDAILVTGDIADHGLATEYEEARKILSSPYPVFSCPGNHDVRGAYRQAFLDEGDDGGDGPVNRVHRAAGALFLLCDSSIPGRADGYLADETLAWADDVLSREPGVPAFVTFHHPPVILHSPFIDGIRQSGEQRLAELIGRHPQVAAVLCGHAHTAAATVFAGRPLIVAPGVVSTLMLPWENGDNADYQAPPAVAFHIFDDGRLTTHYRAIT
jgi:Icc protein